MGVGFDAPGDSIIVLNEQTSYSTWEFLYDPRVDQLKAKALALNGGGLGSTPAGALGQTPGSPGATSTTGTTASDGSTPPAKSGANPNGANPTPQQ
jgi:hypothetical protein